MTDDLDARRPVIMTMPKEIDAANASAVGDALDAAFARGAMIVIADCTPTTFCDSVGFNTLLEINQKARTAKAELLFVIAANGLLRRVLELLEMQDALAVYPSIDAAVTASRQLPLVRSRLAGRRWRQVRFIVGLGKIDMDLARIALAITVAATVAACSGPGTGYPGGSQLVAADWPSATTT